MKSVLILFGGNSSEHDISCKSALNVIDNVDTDLFKLYIVGIDKLGNFIECDKENIIKKDWYNLKPIENFRNYLNNIDIVFPLMHGKYGEDGKIQGMLDLFNIKYVGCKNEASMIGMDKNLSKIFFKSINIPQVPYVKYNDNINDLEKLGYPVIVKPCNGGSSIGITKANNKKELKKAIKIASKYDKNIIVEKFINSREFECAILEDKKIVVSNVGEIEYNNDFYDYEDKYINKVKLIIPAEITDELREKIRYYSKKVFTELKCRGMCRVDFLYDEENDKLYLNEINTIPGFTDISMYPMLMKDAGYSYKELVKALIFNAKRC